MLHDRSRILMNHLRGLAEAAHSRDTSDQDLVQAFATGKDEAAFDVLVRRHGPMVLGLCRRLLGNEQDAEDAYQATFLVLARKARSLRARELVGNWLYGVARRTAQKARVARSRRAGHEAAALVPPSRDPVGELTVREAQQTVDQELDRLPAKFRAPLVLCCLEGLARDEAARQLGWPVALVKSRLEQGRELLRQRLGGRGLTLPAGLLSLGLFASAAQAGVRPALAGATVRAGALVAMGASAAGLVSTQAIALSQAMLRTMFWSAAKTWTVMAVLTVLVWAGVAAAYAVMQNSEQQAVQQAQPKPAPLAKGAAAQPGAPAQPAPVLTPEILKRWGQAEVLVLATLEKVQPGPVMPSEPPIYNHTLHLQIGKTWRGSVKPQDKLVGRHAIKQAQEPSFPVGQACIVALKQLKDQWQVLAIAAATAELTAQVELASAVPLGWNMAQDRLLSPWVGLGKNAWPAAAKGQGPLVCGTTGRPALLVGKGIEFSVEMVPPAVAVKYANPDGDGEYRIALKNTTDKAVAIEALLSDGQKILWEESLVILCQGKVYSAPGAVGVKQPPQAVTLKPGESVSTVVNVLRLQGPEWPRGGYRIEFQFALGEKSVTQSFYYMSKHHDPLRERLNK
jgi:RNA polymerase sigma factor (sigma-70 family)